jgi:hypothetical protein
MNVMRNIRITGLALLLAGGLAPHVSAQGLVPAIHVETLHVKSGFGFVYPSLPTGVVMAKFVCGTSSSAEVAPGRYFTAINISNAAGEGAQPLMLVMDLIQTNGDRQVVSGISLSPLPGLAGAEIDCEHIAVQFKADLNTQFVKGFVRLSALRSRSAPLTEMGFAGVAVYTTAAKTQQ